MLNYLDGYNRKEVTLRAVTDVSKGNTVAAASDYTVKTAEDGEKFMGVCTHTADISASVLLSGFVKVSYTGEAPTYGYNKLAGNGSGGVKKDADGREILVVCVDTASSTCGIIL